MCLPSTFRNNFQNTEKKKKFGRLFIFLKNLQKVTCRILESVDYDK